MTGWYRIRATRPEIPSVRHEVSAVQRITGNIMRINDYIRKLIMQCENIRYNHEDIERFIDWNNGCCCYDIMCIGWCNHRTGSDT